MVKIGIPRAFLYHRYQPLWQGFFQSLDLDCLVSPQSSKEIADLGMRNAIDEACLPSKIYLGHVAWLIERCDYILVPRVAGFGSGGTVCTKFQAIYDVVRNTFPGMDKRLLYYEIDARKTEWELRAFLKLGRFLGKSRTQSMMAYMIGKQAEKEAQAADDAQLRQALQKQGTKVLLVSHRYNICDQLIGAPVIELLEAMGVVPVRADQADPRQALEHSRKISPTLPWLFNRELIGALALYQEQVEGIILISSFPCGPDSLVNEIALRRIDDRPVTHLILDGQEGRAGLETRLESFVDMIRFKRDFYHEQV